MSDAEIRKDIEVLQYKRDNVLKKIEYLYSKAESLVVNASPDELTEFKVRCQHLHSHYESFESYQSDIATSYVQLKETTELPALVELNKTVDSKYFYILAAKENLFSFNVKDQDPEVDARPKAVATVKLPKINLPIFDGTLKDWPHFKDIFIALVHKNVSLSPIEKFHFFLSSTKGEPNTLVKSLPLCSDNYELIWSQLNERYDNKRRLACHYIEELLNLNPIHVESPKPLRSLLDSLNENSLALKQMDLPVSLGDFIILHLALKAVDKHTRQLFERKFSDKEFPDLSDFVEFLKDHCKSLEAAGEVRLGVKFSPSKRASNNISNKSSSSLDFPSKRSFHVSNDNQTKPYSCCLYCNQDHNTYHCPSYLKLTPTQRREFVKSKEACFNCLSESHMLSKCRSNRTCFKCKKSHHTTLHEDNSVVKTLGSTKPSLKDEDVPTAALTSAFTCSAHHSKMNSSSSTIVLLGTAIVRIQDKTGGYQRVRALVDPGSQSSFITEACAQRLCLPRHRHSQPIVGLSETTVEGKRGYVCCLIRPTQQDNPILQTNAVVLNRITSPLPSVPLSDSVMSFFRGWNLADPEFYQPGKIDLLIGADLFPQLFDGGRHVTPPGFPTAFHTIFGWLLIGETALPASLNEPLSVNLAILNQDSLEYNLKNFWEIEEPPLVKSHVSPEDELCESIYSSSVK